MMFGFLYCLITERSAYRQPLHEVARQAEKARVDYFQLREKDLTPAELLEIAQHVRSMLVHTKLIVNGQLDVAIASGADGVHLQKDNLPVAAVRRTFPKLQIGYSAHSREEMEQAQNDGADYVFISPVFVPQSKPSSVSPLGTETISKWIAGMRIPVFGLGGITAENISALAACGCAGAAAISLFIEKGYFSSKGMVV